MKQAVPLDETDIYVLFSEHEEVFLFEKDTNKELWRTSFYGDASCGKIGLINEWVIVGGSHIVLWKNEELNTINDVDLNWVFDIRQIGDDEVEILTDPWKENAAIWKFNIITENKEKIRNFDEYK